MKWIIYLLSEFASWLFVPIKWETPTINFTTTEGLRDREPNIYEFFGSGGLATINMVLIVDR